MTIKFHNVEVVLFLLCFATYGYFYQASDHNVAARIDLIRAIVERHTLWIDGYAGYNTADIIQLHGHIYSPKAPGSALAGLGPWILVTSLLHWVFTKDSLDVAFNPFLEVIAPSSTTYWTAVTYLSTLLTVGLLSALNAVLIYRLALRFGAAHCRALLVGLTLPLGTILFPYATEFTGEPVAAFCELAAFYLLTAAPEQRPLAAGLLAGWGVLSDYPTFVVAVVLAALALWKLRTSERLLAFAGGAGIVALLLAVYNKLAFGNPWFLGYEAYALPGVNRLQFTWQAEGFAGITRPHLPVLWDILIWPQRGLFFCNPVLVLLPFGIFGFARTERRAEFFALTAAVAVMILLGTSCADSIAAWGGGTATGPRHLVPALPFMVLTLAFLPRRCEWALVTLAGVSAFLMLMATSVQPHLPYSFTNPFRDFLWPNFSHGNLALNRDTFFNHSSSEGGAFNLGHLLGLGEQLQLWPLLALWIGAVWYLLRLTKQ